MDVDGRRMLIVPWLWLMRVVISRPTKSKSVAWAIWIREDSLCTGRGPLARNYTVVLVDIGEL